MPRVRNKTKALLEKARESAYLIPMAFAMAFSEDQSQEKSDALFQQYFENAITDSNAPRTPSDIKVKLEKKDGSWIVKPDDELLNALTGNAAKALGELEKISP